MASTSECCLILLWILVTTAILSAFTPTMAITALQQDKAMYRKLRHDLVSMRQKAAKLSLNASAPEYAIMETQLLRVEGRINSLCSTVWYRTHVLDDSPYKVFDTEQGLRLRSTSLPFARDMLRYKLYTDGLLSVHHRQLLHDKLHTVLDQIRVQRRHMNHRIQTLNELYSNLTSASVPPTKKKVSEIFNNIALARQQLEELTN